MSVSQALATTPVDEIMELSALAPPQWGAQINAEIRRSVCPCPRSAEVRTACANADFHARVRHNVSAEFES